MAGEQEDGAVPAISADDVLVQALRSLSAACNTVIGLLAMRQGEARSRRMLEREDAERPKVFGKTGGTIPKASTRGDDHADGR